MIYLGGRSNLTKLDETLTMLKDLTDANGIPGNEREPRDVMKKYIAPFSDEIEQDGLGSLIASKTGDENGPKIMVAGHLDEVGFMVSKIDDKGFLSFQTVGGWWSQVMLAQRVTIVTRSGETVTGVIGSKPPHILSPEARKKPVDIKDMFIDIGATSKEEAEKWGILPGDMVVPYFEFTVMKNEKLLLAKAWDNRIGIAIAIDVLKGLKDVNTSERSIRRWGSSRRSWPSRCAHCCNKNPTRHRICSRCRDCRRYAWNYIKRSNWKDGRWPANFTLRCIDGIA